MKKKSEKLKWITETRVVDDLIPHATNPRTMTEKQVKDLTKSLERFGLVEIPVINLENTILAGHQRLKIMQLLGRGQEKIDVRIPSRPLTKQEGDEYLIRSNKNNGAWDFEILANVFDVPDLVEWGFEEAELFGGYEEPIILETIGDNDCPTSQENVLTVYGDIYQLGRHSLTCGDSTVINDVQRLQGEGKTCADMIFTDPPYGVDYTGKTKDGLKIKNDSLGDEGTRQLVADILKIAPLKQGGSFYICAPPGNPETHFRLAIQDAALLLKQCIVWVKSSFVMGRQDYHWQHESVLYGGNDTEISNFSDEFAAHQSILYGWSPGDAHYFKDDRKQSTVWEYPKPSRNRDHPTMKPVELVLRAILNSSKNGQTVYDPCGGSGTTLIACEKAGRSCMTMELDPKYCDVIVRRYLKFCQDNDIKMSIKRNGEDCKDFF